MKSVYLESTGWHPDLPTRFAGVASVAYGDDTPQCDHEARATAAGCAGLMIGSTWQITHDVLQRMALVEVVGRPGIGYENIDLAAATDLGVAVINTPDAPTESTAEHAVALLMALARRLVPAHEAARAARFAWNPGLQGIELAGKTLGVLGLGRIGGRVAEICSRGLRMRVLAYDPYATPARAASLGANLVPTLAELLPQLDFLSINAPTTPATRKIIDAAALAAMKPSACIVNCARGALVDEPALVAALQAGRLAGAALDVYDPEPPRSDNPLLQLDNVLLSPHIASFTPDAVRAMCFGAAEQIVDVLSDRRPAHLLNPEVWDRPNRRSRHS